MALADAISTIKNNKNRKETAELIASVCAGFNGSFDRQRFLDACNVK
jgi:hypothetical protein